MPQIFIQTFLEFIIDRPYFFDLLIGFGFVTIVMIWFGIKNFLKSKKE